MDDGDANVVVLANVRPNGSHDGVHIRGERVAAVGTVECDGRDVVRALVDHSVEGFIQIDLMVVGDFGHAVSLGADGIDTEESECLFVSDGDARTS